MAEFKLIGGTDPVVTSGGPMTQGLGWPLHEVELSAPLIENITGDYTVPENTSNSVIVCNNTSLITITLPTLVEGYRVTVIRAGIGAVNIDGAGTDITGEPTQAMPSQYDAADMFATAIEWVLT
jgi:hypothetical protein